MSHTRSGIAAFKKASAETAVKVADGTILPVDGPLETGKLPSFHIRGTAACHVKRASSGIHQATGTD